MNFKTALIICTLVIVSCAHNEKVSKSIDDKLLVDLSHDYSNETVYWVTEKDFELHELFAGETEKGYYYAANTFTSAEHGGTHVDAPIHFSRTGQKVDEIPLEHLIGQAIKINVADSALEDSDYQISVQDLKEWESEQGQEIPSESIVLLETGYSSFYPNKKKYLGTDKKGAEAAKLLHFPGLSPEAAQWLVSNRDIHAIGIDTPSIDYGQSYEFKSHVILLGENIPVFENLTNLNKLPLIGFDIVALPMKIKGGSGAPLRVVAFLDSERGQ